jgi:Bacteriocin-protection, YdeI or OmpD-Associated/Domain of unknown function (DUF1905)
MESGPHLFSARIYKVGLIRYVDVPAKISRALQASKSHLPVSGSVEGLPLRTTMVSRGNRCHRLAIHGDLRKKLRIDAGAIVEVAIDRDEESREPVLPPALVIALRHSPKAQAVFRAMTTALRRQIVRYLSSAKQQATVERRVSKFILRLEKLQPRRQSRKPRSNLSGTARLP